ncbi:hypothetical protein [Streptomyces wuyuanensis]|uniref:hypothetical protein n=1 Tax=Streptomyces wuyuanensis TaxID=1196353 RepID=UPI00371FCCE0
MTTRTMLPPNLTRHFYEARRAFMASAGQEMTPWFQLSPLERTVVESEMELFRQAIRAAEEEQDLLASLQTSPPATEVLEEPPAGDTAAAEDTTTTGGPAADDCTCPGCSAMYAFLQFVEQQAGGPKPSGINVATAEITVVPLDTRAWGVPLTEEEKTRLETTARDKIDRFITTASIDLDILDGTAPGLTSFDLPHIVLNLDRLERSPFADYRARFWGRPPTVDKA